MRVLRSILLGASMLSMGVVVSTGCAERPGKKKDDKEDDKAKKDKKDKKDEKKAEKKDEKKK